MSKVVVNGKIIVGHFSKTSGSKVRDMYSSDGEFLGVIAKLDEGGYRVIRKDGKQRNKLTLEAAYRTIGRAN